MLPSIFPLQSKDSTLEDLEDILQSPQPNQHGVCLAANNVIPEALSDVDLGTRSAVGQRQNAASEASAASPVQRNIQSRGADGRNQSATTHTLPFLSLPVPSLPELPGPSGILPSLPPFPEIPSLESIFTIPSWLSFRSLPTFPTLPAFPSLGAFPSCMPTTSGLPAFPNPSTLLPSKTPSIGPYELSLLGVSAAGATAGGLVAGPMGLVLGAKTGAVVAAGSAGVSGFLYHHWAQSCTTGQADGPADWTTAPYPNDQALTQPLLPQEDPSRDDF